MNGIYNQQIDHLLLLRVLRPTTIPLTRKWGPNPCHDLVMLDDTTWSNLIHIIQMCIVLRSQLLYQISQGKFSGLNLQLTKYNGQTDNVNKFNDHNLHFIDCKYNILRSSNMDIMDYLLRIIYYPRICILLHEYSNKPLVLVMGDLCLTNSTSNQIRK